MKSDTKFQKFFLLSFVSLVIFLLNFSLPKTLFAQDSPTISQTVQVLGEFDNYNPLVDGIRQSYGGQILGANSLPQTAEVKYSSQKLPSGNFIDDNHFISIPKIGLDQPVYIPQKIGNQLTVGHGEVLVDDNFYYGHNATGVFGSIYKLNIGDLITINKDGQSQTYKIDTKLFVHQSQIEAIQIDQADQIVLMTCSYTKPDHRIVIKANLVNNEKTN